jgi:hypothetical protein
MGVHIGPRSWVRFRLKGGAVTPWFQARKLNVNQRLVVLTGGRAHPDPAPSSDQALLWEDVAAVEVNDFDLAETVAGATAGSVIVVTAAAAEVLLLGAIAAVTGGHASGDLGITRGAVDLLAGEVLKRPDEAPDAGAVVLAATATELEARPLFSGQGRRRDLVLFTAGVEGGLGAGDALAPVGGVTAGLRIDHLFDLGLGVRTSLAGSNGSRRTVSAPFLRLGLHLDLDAGRRVAVAVGAELGGTSSATHARFLFGARVRITDSLQLGLYPWNPVATTAAEPGAPPSPSRVSLLEVSWLL